MNNLRLVVAFSLIASSLSASAQSRAVPAGAAVARTTKVPGARNNNNTTTIQGNALTSTNGPLSNSIVRLRDARFGGILDVQTTDNAGLFAFRGVEPGSYIVEVMAEDQTTVLTASQILNVNAGDAISAIVKLPFRIPPFAGVMGNNTASSVAAIATQAATSGIVAVTSVGDVTCPLQ